jgi:transcription elongation GreA/GreB family factor
MRLPNRKPGKYTYASFDPVMTAAKLEQLTRKLERLKTITRPAAINETKRLGENGDFSENAEYQIAKGRLRGINRTIDELERRIAHAQVIAPPADTATVQVGHRVTVASGGREMTFTILGPSETDPARGIISYQSALGAALLNTTVGDTVSVGVATYTVVAIEPGAK